jgi:hypothetical protein
MYAALGLALASACASAQTSTSRPTATEPVDTIISRFPDQTPARRSLAPAPAAPSAPAASDSLITRAPTGAASRFVPPAPAAAAEAPAPAGVEEAAVEPSRPAPRMVARRAPHKAAARAPTRAPKAIARRRPAPSAHAPRLALSGAQRAAVYAAIAQQGVFPGANVFAGMSAPAPAIPSFAWSPTWSPQAFPPLGLPQFAGPEAARAEVTVPLGYASSAPVNEIVVEPTSSRMPANYVGRRLPRSVILLPIPEAVVVQMPALWRYRYVLVNDRVLLVDPATNIIVADVTQ